MKHKALVVGAGRIGAGWNWHDDEYTHAGAYRALADRVELVGFVEALNDRAVEASLKWQVQSSPHLVWALDLWKPDVVSVCTQPEQQYAVIVECIKAGVKGIWCEKPYMGPMEVMGVPVQVNYLRRGDALHQGIARGDKAGQLVVYGKDDIHTKCHFEDLAAFWSAQLDYRVFSGPCAYVYRSDHDTFFDNGGVDGGACMRAMLGNLLDCIEGKTTLWSPATKK